MTTLREAAQQALEAQPAGVRSDSYEERLAKKAMFSFSLTDAEQESELSCVSCVFFDLNNDDGAEFHVVERDDKKGFNVFMHGVKITPASYITAAELPRWLAWLVSRFGKRVDMGAAITPQPLASKEKSA